MDRAQQELELRAFLALQGASGAAGKVGDWRRDVAAAFRSREPLSPEFREVIAELIDGGRFGFRLELMAQGGLKKQHQDWYGGVLVRIEWMKIGEWMAGEISGGSTRAAAISAAATAKQFSASREKCDAALVYHGRVTRWLARVRNAGGAMATLPDDDLMYLFHADDAQGRPRDQAPHIAPKME